MKALKNNGLRVGFYGHRFRHRQFRRFFGPVKRRRSRRHRARHRGGRHQHPLRARWAPRWRASRHRAGV